jgi:hypothetical protein
MSNSNHKSELSEGERSSGTIRSTRSNPGVLLHLNDPEMMLRDQRSSRRATQSASPPQLSEEDGPSTHSSHPLTMATLSSSEDETSTQPHRMVHHPVASHSRTNSVGSSWTRQRPVVDMFRPFQPPPTPNLPPFPGSFPSVPMFNNNDKRILSSLRDERQEQWEAGRERRRIGGPLTPVEPPPVEPPTASLPTAPNTDTDHMLKMIMAMMESHGQTLQRVVEQVETLESSSRSTSRGRSSSRVTEKGKGKQTSDLHETIESALSATRGDREARANIPYPPPAPRKVLPEYSFTKDATVQSKFNDSRIPPFNPQPLFTPQTIMEHHGWW